MPKIMKKRFNSLVVGIVLIFILIRNLENKKKGSQNFNLMVGGA